MGDIISAWTDSCTVVQSIGVDVEAAPGIGVDEEVEVDATEDGEFYHCSHVIRSTVTLMHRAITL